MDELKKIAVLESMVEAQMLESALTEQDIPHLIKSYHDTAYDGLFQSQLGWGCIEAPASYESEILQLLNALRTQGDESEA